jgi:hypothetical protein
MAIILQAKCPGGSLAFLLGEGRFEMKKLFTMLSMLFLVTCPSQLWAQSEVAVYQESSPGTEDFEANFLGRITVFNQPELSAIEVYRHDVGYMLSYNGIITNSISNTSQLFLVNTSDGVSLFVVHDKPSDDSGGRAEMRFEISGDPDGAERLVEDDINDVVYYNGHLFGPYIFQTNHQWDECCTDGVVIGKIGGDWSMLVSFFNVDEVGGNEIAGINNWVATSADGSLISLNPFVGQRVLLVSCTPSVAFDIKPGSCPNPLNVKSKGVLPAAIMGTDYFDVTTVDPSSLKLRLKGTEDIEVSPLRWAYADVGEPFEPFIGKDDCYQDCAECTCPDGNLDLVFHFETQEVVSALGEVYDNDCLVVEIVGNLKEEFNGASFIGEDVLRIISKDKP